ncbi:low-specificity L-threonine aldolase [Actinomarinicola tropica]|uniref:Low-specificity L-threonine aldolase n=1 Tax=Actinomarinicola tropica TaxID=2789776 RepID=A0A5Q2RQD4_9ACTN|nr:low-specificity L-threonine aldolase [Actinomarinicola tropica]QGG96347.1 low-specificity L-threonine aldolase [Actinomarinicola tropica]
MRTIDLRSDTVTTPTPSMRRAMAEAEVGDDVFGDDPTVARLQAMVAERLGQEAALFVPSGTQSNLLALMSHCDRGDEYIAGQSAHTYRYEGGGAAVLGGIQPQPVELRADGTYDLHDLDRYVKPQDPHFARTRLVCVENTIAGTPLPVSYLPQVRSWADRHGLAVHLDGARLMNAAVALGVDALDLARGADSVSLCLSKGLGAPVGSVLSGPRDLVERAHRWRKVVGGGMRQAGVLAAAGIVALTDHVDRLAVDHDNARALADGLASIGGVEVVGVATNHVVVSFARLGRDDVGAQLAARGIRVLGDGVSSPMRLVTHLDVTADDVTAVVAAVAELAEAGAG